MVGLMTDTPTAAPKPTGAPRQSPSPARTKKVPRGTRRRRGPSLRSLLITSGVVFLVLLVIQQLALKDLRRLEADFMEARQPTACGQSQLTPFAFDVENEDFEPTLDRIVVEGRDEVAAIRDRFKKRSLVLPIPQVTAAHKAVDKSMDAQFALYVAMVDDPQNSTDEMTRSGLANHDAEKKLQRLRNVLAVQAAEGWDRRFQCKPGRTSYKEQQQNSPTTTARP